MGVSLHNMDCMEALASMADDSFDIAIVDPPYGGGGNADGVYHGECGRFGRRFDKYHICPGDKHDTGGVDLTATCIKARRTGGRDMGGEVLPRGAFGNDIRHWDYAPPKEYFEQLFRVSRSQVIWGGNYFDLPATRCFIVWRKTNIPLKGFTMAPCEYAWTSFNRNAEMFECSSFGTKSDKRFHPTQKPVQLYEWVLERFAKGCKTVLDTHAGSASLAIACHRLGFDYTGYEIDGTYYALAMERLENEMRQLTLFSGEAGA